MIQDIHHFTLGMIQDTHQFTLEMIQDTHGWMIQDTHHFSLAISNPSADRWVSSIFVRNSYGSEVGFVTGVT